MLRFFFRAFGLLMLACAFAAVIVDGTRSIAANGVVFTTVGQILAGSPDKLAALETAAGRVHPWLRDPGLTWLLPVPLWLLAGLVGGAMLALTRPRRPIVGFSSR